MPDFQNDDFALLDGKFGQAFGGGAFRVSLIGVPLEPAARFHFPGQPPPERAAVIQRAVPKTPYQIMLRLFGAPGLVHQREERFLQNVLGFRVAKTQRAAIENQLRRFRFIQLFQPIVHDFNG